MMDPQPAPPKPAPVITRSLSIEAMREILSLRSAEEAALVDAKASDRICMKLQISDMELRRRVAEIIRRRTGG